MKKLTCEMCGGTDLIKQDGVFVCQSCGCKYSVEEARKLMIEGTVDIQGTVVIDHTDEKRQKVENYLSMCKNAHDALDTASVVEYSDKILEIDPNNYEAWAYRALSCGWKSSLNDMKTGQVITAAQKALELAPEEKRYELAENIYTQGKLQIISHLKTVFSLTSTAILTMSITMAAKQAEMVAPVMKAWVMLVSRIPYLTAERMEAEIQDCKELSDKHTVIIATAVSAFNDKKPYYVEMRELLAPKMETAKREYSECVARRHANYWAEHAEEQAALEQEKSNIKDQIDQMKSTAAGNSAQEAAKLQAQLDTMTEEYKSLGIFQMKRMRELEKSMEDLKAQLKNVQMSDEDIVKKANELFDGKLDALQARLSEVNNELAKDR